MYVKRPKLKDIENCVRFIEEFMNEQNRNYETPKNDNLIANNNNINDNETYMATDNKNNKKRVYIHCKGGAQRSACIAIAWLIYSQKISLNEAFWIVKKTRIATSHKVIDYPSLKQFAAMQNN